MGEKEENRIGGIKKKIEMEKRQRRKTAWMARRGWGRFLWRVSHCDLSAVIILVHHLRRGMPHPGAHAWVARGNHRQRVFMCTHVLVGERVKACLCAALGSRGNEVLTHAHEPRYGAVELWLPQHLID